MSFLQADIERDGVSYHLRLLELENAIIAFFYESDMKLGTLAFSMPRNREFGVGQSSVLLGGRYLFATRAAAERVSGVFDKMSLVSIHTRLSEQEAFRMFAELLGRLRLGKTEAGCGFPNRTHFGSDENSRCEGL